MEEQLVFNESIDSTAEGLNEKVPAIVPNRNFVHNVFLDKIEVVQKKNEATGLMEDDTVDVHFIQKSASGQVIAAFRYREWNPFKPKYANPTLEGVQKEALRVQGNLKHIAGRFVESEKLEFKIKGDGAFFKYVKEIIRALGNAHKDVPATVKFILKQNAKDGKWYTALPKYPSFISTEKFPSPFKIDPKYDIFEQPNGSSAMSDAPATASADVGSAFV